MQQRCHRAQLLRVPAGTLITSADALARSDGTSPSVQRVDRCPVELRTGASGCDPRAYDFATMVMNEDQRVRFGARLRHARVTSRLSLGELAERSGVTKSFLSRVERDITSPSVASLVGICDALGLPLADLFQVPQASLVRRA